MALTGSRAAARRAGSQQAKSPTEARTRATLRTTVGSEGEMPMGREAIRCVSGQAAASPMRRPAAICQRPLVKTVRIAQGQVGIEALDSRAHSGKWTAGGFDKQRHVAPAILAERHE